MSLTEHPREFENLGEIWDNCFYCGGNRYFPKSWLVPYKGQLYCKAHFEWRFRREFEDEVKLEGLIDEEQY